METRFRSDLIQWLRDDVTLAAGLNAIEEESPLTASPPWLGLSASAAIDWGAKGAPGREVRVALELIDRQQDSSATADFAAAIETRIATMPATQDGYRVVVTQFLRSRAERRANNLRAVLLEYRFRLLANP
ncbi:MAG: DUF3168 domain-containing protein [Sphingomonadaceae bacterium]